MPTRVLIVDDDYAVRRSLHLALFESGFDVAEASCADEALAMARAVPFDATLLDINMPGKNGVQVCRELRGSFPSLAILMLTAHDGEDSRVAALDEGADDYVAKPFQLRELVARIRAAVRRVQTPARERDSALHIGAVKLCPARRTVEKNGQPVHLTPKEFDLLHYLMLHPGMPIPHGRLLGRVWGPAQAGETVYLRTFIRQLRGKLEDDHSRPRYILTDNHLGYRFCEC